jgi:hypothetical protein
MNKQLDAPEQSSRLLPVELSEAMIKEGGGYLLEIADAESPEAFSQAINGSYKLGGGDLIVAAGLVKVGFTVGITPVRIEAPAAPVQETFEPYMLNRGSVYEETPVANTLFYIGRQAIAPHAYMWRYPEVMLAYVRDDAQEVRSD